MTEHPSAFAEFSRTIWAKLLGVLTVIMMVLGIYVELVTSWRGTSEGISAQAVAHESALRQEAERREKQALSELAAIKASNARQRDKGEAEKLEGEGQAAQATGKYADARQAAEAEIAHQKARSEAASADINEVVAGMVTGGRGWSKQATAMTAPQAFGGNPNWAQDESRKGIASAFGINPPAPPQRKSGDLYWNMQAAMAPDVPGFGGRSPATTETTPTTGLTRARYDDLTDDCKAAYNQWVVQPGHAAFLAREGGQCVYSFGEPSQDAAMTSAMNVCTRKGYACKIVTTK
jgi:hypothetical protein